MHDGDDPPPAAPELTLRFLRRREEGREIDIDTATRRLPFFCPFIHHKHCHCWNSHNPSVVPSIGYLRLQKDRILITGDRDKLMPQRFHREKKLRDRAFYLPPAGNGFVITETQSSIVGKDCRKAVGILGDLHVRRITFAPSFLPSDE